MFDKIKEVIVENLDVKEEEVQMEARLVEDLGADSLDAVEISMALEDEFDIEIADEDLENLETVEDIVNAIKDQL